MIAIRLNDASTASGTSPPSAACSCTPGRGLRLPGPPSTRLLDAAAVLRNADFYAWNLQRELDLPPPDGMSRDAVVRDFSLCKNCAISRLRDADAVARVSPTGLLPLRRAGKYCCGPAARHAIADWACLCVDRRRSATRWRGWAWPAFLTG